jgi:hypothetical protein
LQHQDYLEYVTEPMDFETMQIKLDQKKYLSAESFVKDVELIVHNATTYNPDPKCDIFHKAKALEDTCHYVLDRDLNEDFEADCREIEARRREQPLPAASNHSNSPTGSKDDHDNSRSGPKETRKPSRPKRSSNWSRGISNSRKRSRTKSETPQEEKENATSEDNDEEEEEEPSAAKETAAAGASVEKSSPSHARPSSAAAAPPHVESPPGQKVCISISKVSIDKTKLSKLQEDAVDLSEGFDIERLEMMYLQLKRLIERHQPELDKTRLLADIKIQIDSLRTTTATSKQKAKF